MAATITTPNTVLSAVLPKEGTGRLVGNIVTVVLGSLLLALSAKVSVPVLPIPVTLQTLAVAFLAAGFGARIAVATVLLYIAQGLAGLPVFATGGGLDYIFRPSFGFIVGYVPMAWIIGEVADRFGSRNFFTIFGAMIVGDAIAFAFGFGWLLVVANLIVGSGAALPSWLDAANLVASAYDGAVKPFVLWDLVKMAFAAITVTGVTLAVVRKPS